MDANTMFLTVNLHKKIITLDLSFCSWLKSLIPSPTPQMSRNCSLLIWYTWLPSEQLILSAQLKSSTHSQHLCFYHLSIHTSHPTHNYGMKLCCTFLHPHLPYPWSMSHCLISSFVAFQGSTLYSPSGSSVEKSKNSLVYTKFQSYLWRPVGARLVKFNGSLTKLLVAQTVLFHKYIEKDKFIPLYSKISILLFLCTQKYESLRVVRYVLSNHSTGWYVWVKKIF